MGRERDGRQVFRGEAQTVALEVELAGDGRVQIVEKVGDPGRAHAGRDLLGPRHPAEGGAALDEQHIAALPPERGRGGEAVVAATDHDRIVHGLPRHLHVRRPSTGT
nr:hypothetical protein [Lutibaculum baratangense]